MISNCSGTDSDDPPGGSDEPDCGEALTKLYEYLDGELDQTSLIALEAHIHRCGPCLDTYDFHVALRRVVAFKCSEAMPPELKRRILGMLDGASAASD